MNKTEHYLKPAWVHRQIELAFPLLPPGSGVALQMGSKRVVEMNQAGFDLVEGGQGIQTFPLALEGERVGVLLLHLPQGSEIVQAETWGQCLVHTLQGMLESELGRRSVARETLESYREMALLQRAVTDLNHSLKPSAVAKSLLKEFEGRNSTADCGAVFVRDADSGNYDLAAFFGNNAGEEFVRFRDSRMFADMAARETGDILNDLSSSPLCAGNGGELLALLWLPLIAHGEKLGLLVLASRSTKGFSAADLKRAQTLSSVAATALRNAQLYAAEQKMFQSFVRVIATAIDAKSPYTAGHCRRVPEITLMIAEAAHKAISGPFADFVMDEDKRNAMEIAAILHDCGKMITPEWVMDKASKLDCIVNRIQLVALRFEVLRRDAVIDYYRALAEGTGKQSAESVYQERLCQLEEDFAFIEKCNSSGELVTGKHIARIQTIALQRWADAQGETHPLLDENEIYNLSIPRGTLNPEERKTIEDHVVHTINMLSQISFPSSLRNITEYAGGHHERMNGSGYPYGLKCDQLSIPARILAIADIFEALTAPDRPYRKPGTLSWAIGIMHRMKLDNHIDGDLFDLFLSENIFMAYASKYLTANQIDNVEVGHFLAMQER